MKKIVLLLGICISMPIMLLAQESSKQDVVYTSKTKGNPLHRCYRNNLQHPYFQFKLPKKDFRCFLETSEIFFGTDDSIPPCYIFYFDTSDYDLNKSYFYASYVTARDNPKLFAMYCPCGYPFAYNKFVNSCKIDKPESYYQALKWCENELQQGRLVSISIYRQKVKKKRESSGVCTNGRKLEYYVLAYYMRSFDFNPKNIKEISDNVQIQ